MTDKTWTAPLILLLVFASAAFGEPDPKLPPIKAVNDVKPKASVYEAARWDKPIDIRSKKEAAKHFAAADLATLMKSVDFEQQIVLVFAWRGSGQDRLEFVVAESYPEQVFFTLKPGRTRDLRSHAHVYVLRSNVVWSTKAGAGGKDEK